MFESSLSFLLKTLLGEYVEDGDSLQEKITPNVWSGFIVLEVNRTRIVDDSALLTSKKTQQNLVLKNSILSLLVRRSS